MEAHTKAPSIKKNFFYSGILSTLNYIFPLITYPYVSRVLGVDNIGACNFVDSIINYFILFSMMGVGVVGVREIAAHKDNREELNKVFSNLFWLNTISTSIMLAVLVIAINTVPQLSAQKHLMYIGALKLVFNCLLIEWFYKGLENFRFVTTRSVLVRVIYVIAVFVFVHKPQDYPVYYLLLTLTIVANATINWSFSYRYVRLSSHGISLRPLVKSFLILGVYMLLTSMYTTFNIAYLGFTNGTREVGYYTTATKLYGILLGLYSAFTTVMLPRMSALLEHRELEKFKTLLHKSIDILLSFAIPIVMWGVIMAPQIVDFIAGKGYEGAIVPMRLVMPLLLIIGYEQILIIQGLMPLHKDRQILTNTILGASVGILLNIMLVPLYKSTGSAMVWITSEITVLCSAQYFMSKDIAFMFPFKRLLKNIGYYLPMAGIMLVVYFLPVSKFVSLLAASILAVVYVATLQLLILKNPILVPIVKNILCRKK